MPTRDADASPTSVSAGGELLLAALLRIEPAEATQVREQLPPRRRPPPQEGPSRDWGR
jgi:hypothetical protein